MGGAFQEAERVLREIVFGIGDRQSGRLREGKDERDDDGPDEPAPAEAITVGFPGIRRMRRRVRR